MRTFAVARMDGSLQLEDPLKIPLAPAASTNSPSMAQTGKFTPHLRNLLSTAVGSFNYDLIR
jgi:hypothetical protein